MRAGNFLKSGVIAKVILALLVLCPWSPAAASTAMYTFDTPNFYGNNYYLPQTLGDIFTPAENITVTSLGLFDYQDNGLGEAHEVGIFNQSGTLLASGLVSAGTVNPLADHFRYAAIAPLALTAGQTYIAGQRRGAECRGALPYHVGHHGIRQYRESRGGSLHRPGRLCGPLHHRFNHLEFSHGHRPGECPLLYRPQF